MNLNYSQTAIPVSAYIGIPQSAIGQNAPVLTNGSVVAAGAGSGLGGSPWYTVITWVTANGETLPSNEITTTTTLSDQVTVTRPTPPSTGVPVVSWNVYGGLTSGMEQLNANVPIATSSYVVTAAGSGKAQPVANTSGVVPPLPKMTAQTSGDWVINVPNVWSVFRPVILSRPNATADPTGVSIGGIDVISTGSPSTQKQVRVRFVNASSSTATPTVNAYQFFQI